MFEEKKKLRMFGPYYIAKNNLVIKDLSKFYGNFMAVNQLSVGVDKGECFGLLGGMILILKDLIFNFTKNIFS